MRCGAGFPGTPSPIPMIGVNFTQEAQILTTFQGIYQEGLSAQSDWRQHHNHTWSKYGIHILTILTGRSSRLSSQAEG